MPIKVELDPLVPVVSDDEDSSSSSSTDSSSPDSMQGVHTRPAKRARPMEGAWVIHVKSRIIYVVSPEDDEFLLCGRPLSGNYRPTAEADEWAVECRLCKAAQHR